MLLLRPHSDCKIKPKVSEEPREDRAGKCYDVICCHSWALLSSMRCILHLGEISRHWTAFEDRGNLLVGGAYTQDLTGAGSVPTVLR